MFCKEVDFSKLEAELPLLGGLVKDTLPGVRIVSSMDTLVDMFSESVCASSLIPNIRQLLKLYLITPMSIAAGERTFSVLRRVKSYIRNSMTNKRTNNLLVLHIHKEKTDCLNLVDIAKQFVEVNERRRSYFGKF